MSSWYLRSLGDHETHRGQLGHDGIVLAVCGASFRPRPTLQVAGPPPGELVASGPALRGNPPDPHQVCAECARRVLPMSAQSPKGPSGGVAR